MIMLLIVRSYLQLPALRHRQVRMRNALLVRHVLVPRQVVQSLQPTCSVEHLDFHRLLAHEDVRIVGRDPALGPRPVVRHVIAADHAKA